MFLVRTVSEVKELIGGQLLAQIQVFSLILVVDFQLITKDVVPEQE